MLLAKLLIVAVILSIAAINRFAWTKPVLRGDARGRTRMTKMIGVEIFLAVAVLALVSTWRFTPPPRALENVVAPTRELRLRSASALADLQIVQGDDKRWLACVAVSAAGSIPLDAQSVALVWSKLSLGTEALRREARKQGDGRWCTEPLSLPVDGRWHVAVEAVVNDFEQVRIEGDLDMPRTLERIGR